MAAPVLSIRALNRALLARQLLLERAELSIPAALEQISGLQTQYAPSGYIGLWSRLRRFERSALSAAIEQRHVIQATLMRMTIHMVSARDHHLFAAGVRRSRQSWWLGTAARTRDLDQIDLDKLAACVRSALTNGPRRRAQLVATLEDAGFDKGFMSAAGLWVDMVRVPPSGTWEHPRADLYGLADQWLESVDTTEADGLEHLITCYLRGFGPAAMADIAGWTGVKATTLRPVIDHLDLRRFQDEAGRELLDVAHGLLPDPGTPAPVRFLPTWDATLLVHARRTQILPEEHRRLVFSTKNPHSTPTFLVDGAVAGAWRHSDGRITLQPYRELADDDRQALDQEAERLAAFHAEDNRPHQ